MSAPTNLAEALDCLQGFLPTDKRMMVMQHSSGNVSVSLYVGPWNNETSGSHHGKPGDRLSDNLAAAAADLTSKLDAKRRPLEAAEAEFGPYCPRLAA